MSNIGERSPFQVGDIVEICDLKPQFDGCFALIEKVLDWGVVAMVRGPALTGTAEYPIRIAWAQIARGWKALR